MKNIFTVSEAKNRLPAIIHDVEVGAAAQLTRHGKPVAVLVSITEYNKLKKRELSFWKALCVFRKTTESRNIFLDDLLPDSLRDKTEGRRPVFK
jgi:prevent-host-death family protein